MAASTKVDRSIASGMWRVSHRLNGARAMMVCCAPKRSTRARLPSSATPSPPLRGESIPTGVRLPTKAMKYMNVAKKARYATTP